MKRQAVQLGRFLLSSASLGDTVSDHPDLPNALYADRTVFIGPMRNTFDVRYDPTLHALSLGRVWLGRFAKTHVLFIIAKSANHGMGLLRSVRRV